MPVAAAAPRAIEPPALDLDVATDETPAGLVPHGRNSLWCVVCNVQVQPGKTARERVGGMRHQDHFEFASPRPCSIPSPPPRWRAEAQPPRWEASSWPSVFTPPAAAASGRSDLSQPTGHGNARHKTVICTNWLRGDCRRAQSPSRTETWSCGSSAKGCSAPGQRARVRSCGRSSRTCTCVGCGYGG